MSVQFLQIYISRITKMYSNTLGSPKQIEFFAKEFEVLFGKDFGILWNVFLDVSRI